ncbi:MAG TPA: DUF1461 domain-containing protein [Vicinamibacterales bacterium]|nr:DUF1461 domain-containing protein [Vicinamibacterales bacterium]
MTPIGRIGAAARAVLTGLATVVVIVGIAVGLFFNPLWIGFEQERLGVPAMTGWTPEEVGATTSALLADLFIGPPSFTVTVDGEPVLDAAERSHMVDVRNVVLPAALAVVAALVVLAALAVTGRQRAWFWRAVAAGSGALAVVGVVVGIVLLLFFEQAFLVFHLVLFPQGNFSFDPRTHRLTQLFPDQFWLETAIGAAVVGLLIAVVLAVAARRRVARLEAGC